MDFSVELSNPAGGPAGYEVELLQDHDQMSKWNVGEMPGASWFQSLKLPNWGVKYVNIGRNIPNPRMHEQASPSIYPQYTAISWGYFAGRRRATDLGRIFAELTCSVTTWEAFQLLIT